EILQECGAADRGDADLRPDLHSGFRAGQGRGGGGLAGGAGGLWVWCQARPPFVGAESGDREDDEGEDEFYLTKILPLTFDKKEVVEFLRSPDLHIGEGGDGAEAVECALFDAVNLNWSSATTPKAIVLVGDKPAHGVIDSFRACTRMKDYRKEVEAIKAREIKIYPILCNNIHETESSFRWMASETGGTFVYLDEISSLSDLLIGICLKETGKLLEYKAKLLEYGDKARLNTILMLTTGMHESHT
ncbi:MAG: hypothetical protein WCL71_12745, partial [Deltaproteobacteria bacterium]